MRPVVTVLCLLAAALALPAVAHAGTYSVRSCMAPDGSALPADGWRSEGGAQFSNPVNACPQGGGLFAHLNGDFDHPTNTTAITWHFEAPADTAISAYKVWRSAFAEPTSENATPIYTFTRPRNEYNGANVREQCPGTGCRTLGNAAVPLDPGNLVEEAGLTGVRDLFFNAACGGNNGFSCRAATGTSPDAVNFRVHAAEIVLEDASDPTFAATPSGSLAQPAGPVAGVQGVSFTASDKGGGIQTASLEVDGQAVVSEPVGDCAPPFSRVVPCKRDVSGGLSFDTARVANGPHSVRLLLADAAGNRASYGPVQVEVANAPPAKPVVPCIPGSPPRVSARLSRSTVGFGSRPTLSGRVLDQAGQGVADTPVQILEGARVVATVRTSRTGRFSRRLPAGASRSVRAGVPVAGGLACSVQRRLSVRAGATLSISRRRARLGQRVTFSGRVRGAIPAGGKLLVLQARDADGRWRPVRSVVRTNASGRYRTSYRFRSSRGRFTYRFRVAVPRERGFAYALGYSRSRAVVVSGR